MALLGLVIGSVHSHTVYNITVGHLPFSDQVMLLTNQRSYWSAIYADQFFFQL